METEFTKDYKNSKERYTNFIRELETISKKYNVVISITGGVIIYHDDAKLDNLSYTNDYTSGDITPQFLFKRR